MFLLWLLNRLLSLKFEPSVAYMMAVSYMKKGKLPEAKFLFERLSQESDSFYKIHYVSIPSFLPPSPPLSLSS